jgi:hypothetical protein
MEILVQTLRAHTGLLTIGDVSDLLAFTKSGSGIWVGAGKLPAVRIAGQWRFDLAELAGWVKARRMRNSDDDGPPCKCAARSIDQLTKFVPCGHKFSKSEGD